MGDPLEVEGLPRDPREMALRLLGMTVNELKQIDEKVISGHQYVGGLKTDINKIVNDVQNLKPTVVQPQPVQHPVPAVPVQQVISNTQLPTSNVAAPVVIAGPVDKDQLEFDFYRKIKPEDLEYQLKKLTSVVEELAIKVDLVYNLLLKKSTQKVNANLSQ